jgi:hypothetical protein
MRTTGEKIKCTFDGKVFKEKKFTYQQIMLNGAKAIYTVEGKPLVTKNKFGKGNVILVGAHYMVQNDIEMCSDGMSNRDWKKQPILKFTDHFIENLTFNVTPFQICRRAEDKEDLSWIINRKGENWTVTMFNYSLKREELVSRPMSTAKVLAEYPYKEVPFEIINNNGMKDVVECFEDRDVNWINKKGKMIIKETISGGDIRVYEFSKKTIKFPEYEEYINYALKKPVEASSVYMGMPAEFAVDGRIDNENYWQSSKDKKKSYYFDMPQWLVVDLEEEMEIDHIAIFFHYWKHGSLKTRQHVYKYTIDVSMNGTNWLTVIDESKNEDPADGNGLERWFKPQKAKYVRVNIKRNSGFAGAQVVELKVMGKEKRKVRNKRKSILPAWEAKFSKKVNSTSKDKIKYLVDLKASSVKPGWMPQGKNWKDLNGNITLYTDTSGKGGFYPKSIYGESVSEFKWKIPVGAKIFASALGFGANNRKASVEFKVLIDGKEKYNSGIYRFGMPVIPLEIDVKGGKELTLIVTDGGDSIAYDYAWWAGARFIIK